MEYQFRKKICVKFVIIFWGFLQAYNDSDFLLHQIDVFKLMHTKNEPLGQLYMYNSLTIHYYQKSYKRSISCLEDNNIISFIK